MFGSRAKRELAQLRDDLERTELSVQTYHGDVILGPMNLFQLMLTAKFGGYSMEKELPEIEIASGMVYLSRKAVK